jgi:hypothetical protein
MLGWVERPDGLVSGEEWVAVWWACDLRDVLVAIDQDYVLSPTEHRRIRAAVASIPERAELHDLALTTSELREHVVAILQAHRDYQHTLQAPTG